MADIQVSYRMEVQPDEVTGIVRWISNEYAGMLLHPPVNVRYRYGKFYIDIPSFLWKQTKKEVKAWDIEQYIRAAGIAAEHDATGEPMF